MFSYQTYKMVHYFGFMMLFFGLGGVIVPSLAGMNLQGKPKKVAFISHGLGLLLILIGGFGMLARLQLEGIPPWINIKLMIWLIMGLAIGVAKRMPSWLALVSILLIAMIAPYMAIYKPI